MPFELVMKNALNAYINAFNHNDLEALVALFAPEATVEDPYGSVAKVGYSAIRTFYEEALQSNVKLTLDAPIRATTSHAAAMAFTATVDVEGTQTLIRVIDIMTFDEQGLINSMRAYFGESDIQSA